MCNEIIVDKTPSYSLIQLIKEPNPNDTLTFSTLCTQTETTKVVDISYELCEKKIFEIINFTIQQDSANTRVIISNIEFGQMFLSLSKFVFIRALVTAVCRCCFSNETNDIDKIKFTNLCSLLTMFINGKQEFEIETFYAFKSVLKRINNQPSMLKNYLYIYWFQLIFSITILKVYFLLFYFNFKIIFCQKIQLLT